MKSAAVKARPGDKIRLSKIDPDARFFYRIFQSAHTPIEQRRT